MAKNIKVTLTLDNSKYNRSIKQSAAETRKFTNETKTGLGGLKTAFAGLFAAIGTREIISLGDEFTNLNNRLAAVTTSQQEAATALQLVRQVASESRSDISATASLFADLTIATKDLGSTQEEIAEVTRVFSQTLAISGADAGAASGAIRQFGQALASGVLRGDEFNSIAETNSAFMLKFAEALGQPLGKLRALAAEGKLTAEIVLEATSKMASEVQEDFDKTTTTVSQSFTKLRNSVIGLFGEVESETGVFEGLSSAISRVADSIDNMNVPELIEQLKQLAMIGAAVAVVMGATGLTKVVTNIAGLFYGTATGPLANFATKLLQVNGIKKQMSIISSALAGNSRNLASKIIRLTAAFLRLSLYLIAAVAGIYAVAEAINFVQKLFTGKDFMKGPRDSIINMTKDLLGLEEQAKETAEAIDPANLIPGSQEHSDFYNLFGTQTTGTSANTGSTINLDAPKTEAELFREMLNGLDRDTQVYLKTLAQVKEDFINNLPGGILKTNEQFNDLKDRLNLVDTAFGDVATAYKKQQEDSKKAAEDLAEENAERQAALDLVLQQVESISGLVVTTDRLNEVNQVLQAFLEKYPELAGEIIEAQQKMQEKFAETEIFSNFIDNLNTGIKTLSEDLVDAFEKGESAGEVFKNFFKNMIKQVIADIIRLMVFLPILQAFGFNVSGGAVTGLSGGGLLGSLGFKATGAGGGNVMARRPMLVGEQGPELFVPSNSGSLTPNHQMGTTVNYNINAVDAPSFQQLVASDPQFIYAVTQAGARTIPGSR